MVWAGDAPAFDLSCEAANEVCANALAQCAQEGLAEACDQEQEGCDEAAAICAAVSTFLAGLDTDQLDEIACQEAASFSVGSGLFDIKDIRLGNVLNPLKRKKELKRIVKMAAKIGLGYGLATTCTPILVGEDYRGGSAEERVTRAVEALQMRSIPVVVREVSDPTDPNSCSTPLALEFDGQNRVTGFGDFTGSEFVYVSRLGSYPALLTLAEALAFAAGPAAAEFLKSEVGDRLVAVPDLDFDPGNNDEFPFPPGPGDTVDPRDIVSVDSALLGVVARLLSIDGGSDVAAAGTNLVLMGNGNDTCVLQYDGLGPPPPAEEDPVRDGILKWIDTQIEPGRKQRTRKRR